MIRIKLAVCIMVIVAGLAWLAVTGFGAGMWEIVTVEGLAERTPDPGERFQVRGAVGEGTIRREGEWIVFDVKGGEGGRLPVRYHQEGLLPDAFGDGAEVILHGSLTAEGWFEAKKLQAKCASRYEGDYGPTYEGMRGGIGDATPAAGGPEAQKR